MPRLPHEIVGASPPITFQKFATFPHRKVGKNWKVPALAVRALPAIYLLSHLHGYLHGQIKVTLSVYLGDIRRLMTADHLGRFEPKLLSDRSRCRMP